MNRTQAAGLVLVMCGTFVAALDNTVVGTAMPTVIGDLGGIDRYGLVFSVYLLVSSVTTPIFGKFADIFGRKRVYFVALIAFVAFSMLCGLSQTMDQLIIFRALQGLGAGALLPTGFTIIGDLFETKERARVQGFISSVWATSAIVGPTIGGIITQALDWRWAFYVNAPIGAIALLLLIFAFHDRGTHVRRPIDWLGGLTFATSASLLLLTLNGTLPALTLAVVAGLFILWLGIERRVAEPIIDLDLVRTPLVSAGLLITLIAGAVQFAMTSYLPPFVQGVQGRLPVEAGLAIAAAGLAWPAGSVITGWTYQRIGVRRAVLIGSLSITLGAAILVFLAADTPLPIVIAGAAAIGFGMGCTNLPILVSIQTSVGYAQRGSATSLVRFARTLGGAAGVAALGGVLTASLGGHADSAALLLDPNANGAAPAVASVRDALAQGMHNIYLVMLAIAVSGVAVSLRLPVHVMSEERHQEPKPRETPAAERDVANRPEPVARRG